MFIVFGIFDGFGFDFEPGVRRFFLQIFCQVQWLLGDGFAIRSSVRSSLYSRLFGPTLNNEIPCFYFQNAFSLYYTIISINSVDL